MRRVTSTLAKGFVCKQRVYTMEKIVEPGEELSVLDQVDFVKSFCFLWDRLNASGGTEATVTARTRIGWIKFRERGELLYGRKFSLKTKERICQSCVRSAMLHWSGTWCLKENDTEILRNEKANDDVILLRFFNCALSAFDKFGFGGLALFTFEFPLLHCRDCNAVYVFETGRSVKTRKPEHMHWC